MKAKIIYDNIQPGDIKETYADIEYSKEKLDYNPSTQIFEGIKNFVNWYRGYFNV